LWGWGGGRRWSAGTRTGGLVPGTVRVRGGLVPGKVRGGGCPIHRRRCSNDLLDYLAIESRDAQGIRTSPKDSEHHRPAEGSPQRIEERQHNQDCKHCGKDRDQGVSGCLIHLGLPPLPMLPVGPSSARTRPRKPPLARRRPARHRPPNPQGPAPSPSSSRATAGEDSRSCPATDAGPSSLGAGSAAALSGGPITPHGDGDPRCGAEIEPASDARAKGPVGTPVEIVLPDPTTLHQTGVPVKLPLVQELRPDCSPPRQDGTCYLPIGPTPVNLRVPGDQLVSEHVPAILVTRRRVAPGSRGYPQHDLPIAIPDDPPTATPAAAGTTARPTCDAVVFLLVDGLCRSGRYGGQQQR
jgi:hypothetical protein